MTGGLIGIATIVQCDANGADDSPSLIIVGGAGATAADHEGRLRHG
jgi:hypothetical protein